MQNRSPHNSDYDLSKFIRAARDWAKVERTGAALDAEILRSRLKQGRRKR